MYIVFPISDLKQFWTAFRYQLNILFLSIKRTMKWCHIIVNYDVPITTLEDLRNKLVEIGFEVTESRNSTSFEIAEALTEFQNPGNDKASTEESGIFLLLIYAFGCGEPNKFFTSQNDSENSFDFVKDILAKIGKTDILERVPKLIFVESVRRKVDIEDDLSK